MLNKLMSFLFVALATTQICCAQQTTQTTVKVVDELGLPLSGVDIKVSYPLMQTGNYSTGTGRTDDEGLYTYSGKSLAELFVTANKVGYYESRHQGMVYTVEDRQQVLFDPEVVLTLKEIKEPISLYARARVSLKVPEYGKELGFDCEAADWVAPYGDGRNADLFFKVDGYYNERDDRDTTLTMSFPNEGDGFITFTGNPKQGSQLVSAHKAPEFGYIAKKKWRKARIPTEESNEFGLRFTSYDDYRKDLNYYLRVQTVLDPDGDVVSAKYAKVYGDFKFDGVWDRESYLIIDALYFNPTTNDRNLEYKVGENLNTGLRHSLNPYLP